MEWCRSLVLNYPAVCSKKRKIYSSIGTSLGKIMIELMYLQQIKNRNISLVLPIHIVITFACFIIVIITRRFIPRVRPIIYIHTFVKWFIEFMGPFRIQIFEFIGFQRFFLYLQNKWSQSQYWVRNNSKLVFYFSAKKFPLEPWKFFCSSAKSSPS